MISLDQWAVDRARALQAEVVDAYERYEFHHIYHKVHNFCVVEMGGFYLDVIKDRLYTTPADGLPRRSAQTAMHHIAEAMVRWLAPILSFTAEEIWQALPGERGDSVFLSSWHGFPRRARRDRGGLGDGAPGATGRVEGAGAAARGGRYRRAARCPRGPVLCRTAGVGARGAGRGAALRLHHLRGRRSSGLRASRAGGAGSGGEHAVLARHSAQRCGEVREVLASARRTWTATPATPGLCARCVGNVAGGGETRVYA